MNLPSITLRLSLDPRPAVDALADFFEALQRRCDDAAERFQALWSALPTNEGVAAPAGAQQLAEGLASLERALRTTQSALASAVDPSAKRDRSESGSLSAASALAGTAANELVGEPVRHESNLIEQNVHALTARLLQLRGLWEESFRAMADAITNTVTGAVSGLSSALADIIVTGKNVGLAFQQLAIQIVTDLIRMTLQAVLFRAVLLPLGGLFGFAQGGVVGAAAGFADGGVVRQGTGPRADDVLIRASRGEYVMPADMTSRYLPLLEAMRRGLVDMRDYADAIPRGLSRPISRAGAYADGGMVGGGVAGDVTVTPAPVNFAILNSQQALREFMERHGSAMAFDYARKHKAQLGIRS